MSLILGERNEYIYAAWLQMRFARCFKSAVEMACKIWDLSTRLDGTGLQMWIGLKKATMNESVSVPKVVSKEVQPRLTYVQSSPD